MTSCRCARPQKNSTTHRNTDFAMSFSFPDATRVRPRHVGTECVFAFVRPEDLCLSASNDPLSQGALEWLPWPRPSGPDGPEASPASFARARPALTGTFFFASGASAEATHRVFWRCQPRQQLRFSRQPQQLRCSWSTSPATSERLDDARSGGHWDRTFLHEAFHVYHHRELVIMFNKNTFERGAITSRMECIPKGQKDEYGSLRSAHGRSSANPSAARPRSRWSPRTCATKQPSVGTPPATCSGVRA